MPLLLASIFGALPLLMLLLIRQESALALPPTCQRCGYDLRGLPSRTPCPECGARSIARRRPHPLDRFAFLPVLANILVVGACFATLVPSRSAIAAITGGVIFGVMALPATMLPSVVVAFMGFVILRSITPGRGVGFMALGHAFTQGALVVAVNAVIESRATPLLVAVAYNVGAGLGAPAFGILGYVVGARIERAKGLEKPARSVGDDAV